MISYMVSVAGRLTDEAVARKTGMGSERSSPAGNFFEAHMAADTHKKKSPRRSHALLVLMNTEERAAINEAARETGVAVGAWLRMLGLREARKMKQAASRNVR